MTGEHPNCQAIEDFLEAIPSIDRPIVQTRNLDNRPVDNGYCAAWHDKENNSGFTVVAMDGGHMRLFIELTGKLSDAAGFAATVNKVFFDK